MVYSTEELDLVDGLIVTYMGRRGVPGTLRESYYRVHSHILEDALDTADLRRIRMALNLLLPCFRGDRDSQADMIRALATTDRLLHAEAAGDLEAAPGTASGPASIQPRKI